MFGPYLIEKRADRAFSGVWLATEGEGMILAIIVLSEWTSAEWSVGQFNMEKYQSCACFQSSAHFFSPTMTLWKHSFSHCLSPVFSLLVTITEIAISDTLAKVT